MSQPCDAARSTRQLRGAVTAAAAAVGALAVAANRASAFTVATPLQDGRMLKQSASQTSNALRGSLAAQASSAETPSSGVGGAAMALVAAAAAACTGAVHKARVATRSKTRIVMNEHFTERTRCAHTPQQIPVVNMRAKQVGEETLDMWTLSKETANYVVHQVYSIYKYQNKKFTLSFPRRGDDGVKKGKKPWAQKGTGRARIGSRFTPLGHKGIKSNKYPHGLDDRAYKKNCLLRHYKSISTVLQSKWRNMVIVDGLEDGFPEANQAKMRKLLMGAVAKSDKGSANMVKQPFLCITRSAHGEENKHHPALRQCWHPIYLSGRLIRNLTFRRPRDIDPHSDGLHQLLKSKRIVISREAFFDLVAKYGREEGWAPRRKNHYVETLQEIAKEFPCDRAEEIRAARELPRSKEERQQWAKEKREEMAMLEAA
eukprot:TRINITY_DN934_c0_g1_i1.p1 TRINITY_DN934_c0_g1~~TRINITY_DN934_c0_g1_i1.p1  ORF type:complete len:429 (-),score=117.91 TRINITY_DN934_c0_g1_i1:81-1367(-)